MTSIREKKTIFHKPKIYKKPTTSNNQIIKKDKIRKKKEKVILNNESQLKQNTQSLLLKTANKITEKIKVYPTLQFIHDLKKLWYSCIF